MKGHNVQAVSNMEDALPKYSEVLSLGGKRQQQCACMPAP